MLYGLQFTSLFQGRQCVLFLCRFWPTAHNAHYVKLALVQLEIGNTYIYGQFI